MDLDGTLNSTLGPRSDDMADLIDGKLPVGKSCDPKQRQLTGLFVKLDRPPAFAAASQQQSTTQDVGEAGVAKGLLVV